MQPLQRAATSPTVLKPRDLESNDEETDELVAPMEQLAIHTIPFVPFRVPARHSTGTARNNLLAQTGMHSGIERRRPTGDPPRSSYTSAQTANTTHRRHRSHDQSSIQVHLNVVFKETPLVSSTYEHAGKSPLGGVASFALSRSLPSRLTQGPSLVAQQFSRMPYQHSHANNISSPRNYDVEVAHKDQHLHDFVLETSSSSAGDLSDREYEAHPASECDSSPDCE